MCAWNPALYMKNAGPRLRPALDLLNRAVLKTESSSVTRVLDLGCGPGNITPYLNEAFPAANVVGVDSSEEMIAEANVRLMSTGNNLSVHDAELLRGRVSFKVGTIESEIMAAKKWTDEDERLAAQLRNLNGVYHDGSSSPAVQSEFDYDVVYSNAALHWVTNHKIVFGQLMKFLVRPHGVLAVQMPDTRTQLSHTLMIDACRKCGFDVSHVRIPRVEHDYDYYYEALTRGQRCDIDMWSTEYVQQLSAGEDGTHPVLDYVRATGMIPVIEALGGPAGERAQKFLKVYESFLHDAYPLLYPDQGGRKTALFPFKRFFLVAKKVW